jgi:hypothetical protein
MREELVGFVKGALDRGVARPEIRDVLLAAGWRREDVEKALRAFAEAPFPLAVPRPQPYLSARETFFYLLQFAALYTTAFNLGRLLFLLIERGFPDPIDAAWQYDHASDGIRWSIASLAVAFPIFLLVARSLARAAERDPERRRSKIRKWLTYLTLFIAATVLTGDLITVLYNLLGGELTARFLLKTVTVAVIAGGIFGYYLWDLRGEEKEEAV